MIQVLHEQLVLGQVAVQGGSDDEIGVGTNAHDDTVFKHNDLVTVDHRGEAVRNDQQSSVD
jgi:hypothetical protein